MSLTLNSSTSHYSFLMCSALCLNILHSTKRALSFAENLIKIGHVIASYDLKVVKTIENKRIYFLCLALSPNQYLRIPTHFAWSHLYAVLYGVLCSGMFWIDHTIMSYCKIIPYRLQNHIAFRPKSQGWLFWCRAVLTDSVQSTDISKIVLGAGGENKKPGTENHISSCSPFNCKKNPKCVHSLTDTVTSTARPAN